VVKDGTVTTPTAEHRGFYEVAIAKSGGKNIEVRHRRPGSTDCIFDCIGGLAAGRETHLRPPA
jgi:hypothetical protein